MVRVEFLLFPRRLTRVFPSLRRSTGNTFIGRCGKQENNSKPRKRIKSQYHEWDSWECNGTWARQSAKKQRNTNDHNDDDPCWSWFPSSPKPYCKRAYGCVSVIFICFICTSFLYKLQLLKYTAVPRDFEPLTSEREIQGWPIKPVCLTFYGKGSSTGMFLYTCTD